MKFHAILPFKCPLSGHVERAKVWFCSDVCRAIYSQRIIDLNQPLQQSPYHCRGSLAEKGFAEILNRQDKCGECELPAIGEKQ